MKTQAQAILALYNWINAELKIRAESEVEAELKKVLLLTYKEERADHGAKNMIRLAKDGKHQKEVREYYERQTETGISE